MTSKDRDEAELRRSLAEIRRFVAEKTSREDIDRLPIFTLEGFDRAVNSRESHVSPREQG